MISKRLLAYSLAASALLGWTASIPAPAVAGGPISDMIGRYKMKQQLKLPPMQEPFSTRPVSDLTPSSMAGRFKKRFSMTKPTGTSITSRGGLFSPRNDPGVARTSR